MTLEEAIQAHTIWTHKLSSYLCQCDGHLTPDEVRAHSRCTIGQWLYREGLRYYALPEYEVAMAEHARFHRIAAKIVERANEGEDVNADHILGSESEYGLAMKSVIKRAIDLKTMVAALDHHPIVAPMPGCEHPRAPR
ncbi:MAG: CZB domain-containing protein [Rhodomicrobium sp.]|jgi:hypothetical protein